MFWEFNVVILHRKGAIILIKIIKILHMSEKSSTFAA